MSLTVSSRDAMTCDWLYNKSMNNNDLLDYIDHVL